MLDCSACAIVTSACLSEVIAGRNIDLRRTSTAGSTFGDNTSNGARKALNIRNHVVETVGEADGDHQGALVRRRPGRRHELMPEQHYSNFPATGL